MSHWNSAKTIAMLLLLALPATAVAHCEIPCGIYDDAMRYDLLEEHIATIEKSMNQIKALSAESEKNHNQLVRWITNKDKHAEKFQEIVWQYFLTQRIKPTEADTGADYQDYQKHLELYHRMLVHAMKCKQTVDLEHVEVLRSLVAKSRELYFKPHEH
jgi:nickel superoxide dismutase